MKYPFFLGLIVISLFFFSQNLLAQEQDSTSLLSTFSGSVEATQNGIALIPVFGLGEPAWIIGMKAGRKLSFEPDFRYSWDGKPWIFDLWWRYNLLSKGRFTLRAGLNPSILFRKDEAMVNGKMQDVRIVARSIVGQILPTVQLNDRVTVGGVIMRVEGLKDSPFSYVDFLALNSIITNIPITNKIYLNFVPQMFFVRLDGDTGIYANATVNLGWKGIPVTFQSIVSQSLQTSLEGDRLIWNLSLVYNFGQSYLPVGNLY